MSQSVKTIRQPILTRLVAHLAHGREDAVKVRHSNVTLEAHFKRRADLTGLALIGGAFAIALQFVPAFGGGGANSGFIPGPAAEFAQGSRELLQLEMLLALLVLVGLRLIYAGLAGARALRIDSNGISAFHVYGTQTLPWKAIGKIEIRQDRAVYGKQLIIQAAWGARSFNLVRGITPIYLDRIDTPLDAVLAAIQAYRPDLEI